MLLLLPTMPPPEPDGRDEKALKSRRRTSQGAIWRVKPKGRSAPKAMPRRGSAPAGQETEVARLTREWDEALGQQAATADVLQIISSSPANLGTVLETILANATRGHASRASARAAPL